jgi:hypothetical protein
MSSSSIALITGCEPNERHRLMWRHPTVYGVTKRTTYQLRSTELTLSPSKRLAPWSPVNRLVLTSPVLMPSQQITQTVGTPWTILSSTISPRRSIKSNKTSSFDSSETASWETSGTPKEGEQGVSSSRIASTPFRNSTSAVTMTVLQRRRILLT